MESSGTWDGTHVPCIGRQIPIHCATWEVPGYHSMTLEEEGNGPSSANWILAIPDLAAHLLNNVGIELPPCLRVFFQTLKCGVETNSLVLEAAPHLPPPGLSLWICLLTCSPDLFPHQLPSMATKSGPPFTAN